MKKIIGEQSEKCASEYLQQQGLQLIAQNFRAKRGEVDLIMHDSVHVVFVEVRYRQSEKFGGAIESIDWFKQQRIIHAAEVFLTIERWAQRKPCRFDVVTLSGDFQSPKIHWIKDAFQIS